MVQPVNRDAYRDQLHALLPSGPAWPGEDGTTLDALLRAIADRLAEVDLSGARLLDEVRPDSSVDLLPDWERVLGLPDSCSQLGSGIAIRRASVLAKLVAQPTMNPSAYVAVAAEFGIDITVREQEQARAATYSTFDTAGGRWRHVWWIEIPTTGDVQEFTTLSDVTEALRTVERNTELECRLEKAAPAHTELFVEYVDVQTVLPGLRFTLPVHNEFANDRLRWEDTSNGLGDVSDLLATAGTEALSRLQINGNGGDGSNFLQLRTLGGAELSAAFEGYASAVTLQAEGLEDMVIAGPASALHDSPDSSEPYQWVPGDDYANGSIRYVWSGGQAAGLAAWVTDFLAAYAADNTLRAVLTLYDGS